MIPKKKIIFIVKILFGLLVKKNVVFLIHHGIEVRAYIYIRKYYEEFGGFGPGGPLTWTKEKTLKETILLGL